MKEFVNYPQFSLLSIRSEFFPSTVPVEKKVDINDLITQDIK